MMIPPSHPDVYSEAASWGTGQTTTNNEVVHNVHHLPACSLSRPMPARNGLAHLQPPVRRFRSSVRPFCVDRLNALHSPAISSELSAERVRRSHPHHLPPNYRTPPKLRVERTRSTSLYLVLPSFHPGRGRQDKLGASLVSVTTLVASQLLFIPFPHPVSPISYAHSLSRPSYILSISLSPHGKDLTDVPCVFQPIFPGHTPSRISVPSARRRPTPGHVNVPAIYCSATTTTIRTRRPQRQLALRWAKGSGELYIARGAPLETVRPSCGEGLFEEDDSERGAEETDRRFSRVIAHPAT